MGGQHCAWPGCRAWAMRGQNYCRMHRQPEQEEPEEATGETLETAEENPFAISIPLDLIAARVEALLAESLEAGSDDLTLREEIGVLRLVLARVMAEEPDLNRQATNVPRIINTAIRAVRTQRLLSGTKASAITEAITQVLIELGLGSDEDR